MDQLEEKLTNKGRVPLAPGLNLGKLQEADRIVKGLKEGDGEAEYLFKKHLGVRHGEALTTGNDFIYAYNHLVNLEVDDLFQEAERTWTQVVPVREVTTFDSPKVYALDPTVSGLARPKTEPGKPDWVAPIVPEGSPYPNFTFKGETASAGSIHKSGGEFDGLTFERIVSDPFNIVDQLPTLITEFLLDREEWDVYNGLLTFIDASRQLQAGSTIDGQAVVKNAPLSRAALMAAVEQLKSRRIKNRALGISTLTLIVPLGKAEQAKFYLNSITMPGFNQTTGDTERHFVVNGYNPLSSITNVVESEYVTESAWYIVPTPGSLRGSKRFLELGRLKGHVGPEIRVENLSGNYYGGGAVSPFEGSFRTDSAALRGRIISGALAWNSIFGIWSTGAGS